MAHSLCDKVWVKPYIDLYIITLHSYYYYYIPINYMLSPIVGLAKANNRGVFKDNLRLTQPILAVQRGNR